MPPEAISDPMTETMTPREAARVLTDAAGFERSLERRTSGLTMMAWGVVVSAMFATYALAAVLRAYDSPYAGWIFGTLWIPWVLAGLLITHALWHSAALSTTRGMVEGEARMYWLRALGFSLAISVVFALARPNGPLLPLAIIGAAWALAAAFNLFRSHWDERRYTLVSGVALFGLAALLGILQVPIEIAGTVSIVAPGLILCALGYWQAMRG